MDKKITGRLAFLNKYFQGPADQQIAKEMIQDGLSNAQILQAFGHNEEAMHVMPDEHGMSDKLPTDEEAAMQQQQEQQDAGPQPGQQEQADVPTEAQDVAQGGDEQVEGDDPMDHAVALINHLYGKNRKPKA